MTEPTNSIDPKIVTLGFTDGNFRSIQELMRNLAILREAYPTQYRSFKSECRMALYALNRDLLEDIKEAESKGHIPARIHSGRTFVAKTPIQ